MTQAATKPKRWAALRLENAFDARARRVGQSVTVIGRLARTAPSPGKLTVTVAT